MATVSPSLTNTQSADSISADEYFDKGSIPNKHHETDEKIDKRDSTQSSDQVKSLPDHVRLEGHDPALDLSTSPQQICFIPRFGSLPLFRRWLPQLDTEATPPKRRQHRKIVILAQLYIATIVFIINLSFTLYSILGYSVDNVYGQYFQGDCDKIDQYNTILHLAINAISTVLLSSSNYCSQILIAPTRADVDLAHSKGQYLDIGIQSFRNWRSVSKRRKMTWVLLMMSSVLLHLIWNSAVFMAVPVSIYTVGVVTSDFANDAQPWDFTNPDGQEAWKHDLGLNIQKIRDNYTRVDRLDRYECIQRYVNNRSGVKDVLLVSSNTTMADAQSTMHRNSTNKNTSLLDMFVTQSYAAWPLFNVWVCDDRLNLQHTTSACTGKTAQPHVDYWDWISTPIASGNTTEQYHYAIDYCLSLGDDSAERNQKCALRFYPDILLGVCILNLLKCACFVYTAILHRNDYRHTLGSDTVDTRPMSNGTRLKCLKGLRSMVCRMWCKIKAPEEITYTKASMITLGDYIASTLEHLDRHTAGLDLATRKDFDLPWRVNSRAEFVLPRRTTFMEVLTRRKWIVTYILMCLLVFPFYALVGASLWEHRKIGMPIDLPSLWAEGVGVFQNYAYFPAFSSEDGNGWFHARKLHVAILFANAPQLLIS
ncbi:hypothetical protein E8E14_003519 [Neopestalotiopsis sp. 37M]|nr:hypothetical protein E8E14_003519 [Neopestalotiopsis sp. 37M]